MSNQKFSASVREALFLAHAGKCAYTRQPLDIANFHIDHILPEELSNDPGRFMEVMTELGLSETFDLLGYENLLPAAAATNLQKGKLIFDTSRAHYFLAIASSRKAEVEEQLERINRRNSRGRALVLLQQALESGNLSPADVAEILGRHQDEPEEIFQLLASLNFANAEEIDAIARADIDSLREKPIIGEDQALILERSATDQVEIRTCREYEQAIKLGYTANSTYAIKGASMFEQHAGLLNSLEKAAPAVRSFIESPRAGIIDLHLMPFQLFPQLSPDITEEDLSGSYREKVASGALVLRDVRQNMLVIEEPEGLGQHLIEVARADFNGDGIEDILVFEYIWATHGTFGSGGIRILTRTSSEGMFEEVRLGS